MPECRKRVCPVQIVDGVPAAGITVISASTGGLDEVRACPVANVNIATDLENGDTVDGVVLATSDRVLLVHQTTTTENGVYTVQASGAAPRDPMWDNAIEFLFGRRVVVSEGDYYGSSLWECRTHRPTLGVTAIRFLRTDRNRQDPMQSDQGASDFYTQVAVWQLLGGGGGSCADSQVHGTDGHKLGEILHTVNAVGSIASARKRPLGGSWYWSTDGPALFQTYAYLEDLCDGVDEFEWRTGVLDSDSGPPTDGWYFQLEPDGVGGCQWAAMTSSAAVRSRFTCATAPVVDAWVNLEARQNENGTLIAYFIDRVLQGTLNTNIPTAAASQHKVQMTKTVGVNQKQIYTDNFFWLKDYFPIK